MCEGTRIDEETAHNKRMHSDPKKRCSFLATLFGPGDA